MYKTMTLLHLWNIIQFPTKLFTISLFFLFFLSIFITFNATNGCQPFAATISYPCDSSLARIFLIDRRISTRKKNNKNKSNCSKFILCDCKCVSGCYIYCALCVAWVVAIVLCQCHCQRMKCKLCPTSVLTGFCGFFNRYKWIYYI